MSGHLTSYLEEEGILALEPNVIPPSDLKTYGDSKPPWGRRRWVEELSSSGGWKQLFSVLFASKDHINRQEGRSFRMLVRWIATHFSDSRVPLLEDHCSFCRGLRHDC